MENLHQHIESLIFSSETAVSREDISECIQKLTNEVVDEQIIDQILQDIAEKYKPDYFSFELRVIGGGYQFFTKPEYHKTVSILIGQKEKKKLSTAALETLAIIAYRGPVTKSECEQIRGVNCDYSVQKLLEKELVEMAGRVEDSPGRPVLYKVTSLFLDYFGINSTTELPKLKEVMPDEQNSIGESSNLQESTTAE
ncbi:MAG: SMC-Scp complex subunit ScpB [Chitinophagales bacterium]|nr:SMC-Scp complex subunit ScpB [Chitinophagales bacterium]OJV25146.1 MAG: SMC-Scp complex subunit ScpB [Bacteroidetes bacterium 37-13]HRN93213.1 SMC-Scp complex subunit ScpB [Chitinophagales bacterium]HRP39538.1 SMC-Scp complex subunit ScpB [Chitinophagales bacterium]